MNYKRAQMAGNLQAYACLIFHLPSGINQYFISRSKPLASKFKDCFKFQKLGLLALLCGDNPCVGYFCNLKLQKVVDHFDILLMI